MKEFLEKLGATLLALAFVLGLVGLPFMLCDSRMMNREKDLIKKVDSLEVVINRMQKIDTLILDMSEYNSKDIEMMNEKQDILGKRVTATERWMRDIDCELDRFD